MSDTSATAPESPEAPEQIIDLDAARKARREKRGSAPKVLFFGDYYELPMGLPANVIDLVGEVNGGDLTKASEAFKILLGGPEIFDKLTAAALAHGEVLDDGQDGSRDGTARQSEPLHPVLDFVADVVEP